METHLNALTVLLNAYSLPTAICNKYGKLVETSKSFNSLWPAVQNRNLQSLFSKQNRWKSDWQLVLRNRTIELIETGLRAPFSEHMLRTSRLERWQFDEQLFLVELHPRKEFTSGFAKLAKYHWQNQRQKHQSHLVNLQMQKAVEESNTDPLTGIANRRAFDEQLPDIWQTAIKGRHPIVLFSIDIDQFKQINDQLGHSRGDEILVQIAQRLDKQLLRDTDLVARVGGEEFAMIMPNTQRFEGQSLAFSTVSAISKLKIPHPGSSIAKSVTISLGCTSIQPGPKDNIRNLIDAADQALYFAKQSGRNCASYMDLNKQDVTLIAP